MRVRTLTAMLVLASVCAACGSDDDGFAPADPGLGDPASSIVALGDSVAAGEGINYGYTYCSDCSPERWTGGTDDPAWEPPSALSRPMVMWSRRR